MLYFVKDRIKDMLIVPIEQLKMVFVVRLQCADLVGTTITSHKVAAWARACVCTTRLTPLTRSFVQARHTRTDTCTHTHTRSSRGCKWPQRHAGTPNWFYIRASGTASKSHRSPKLIAVFDDLFKFLCRQILRISTTCETVCVRVCIWTCTVTAHRQSDNGHAGTKATTCPTLRTRDGVDRLVK